MVREALFDVLEGLPAAWRSDEPVLELYAGSGALGIEALSRGWPQAWFVERDPRALRAIRENLERLHLTGRARVVAADVGRFLARAAAEGRRFRLVLADPPYATGVQPLLAMLTGLAAAVVSGIVALQHPAREELPERSGNLHRTWHRVYGRTGLTLYAGPEAGAH